MEEVDELPCEILAESFSQGNTTDTLEVGVVINTNESAIVPGGLKTVVKQGSIHETVAWGPSHCIPLKVDF